MIRQQQLAGEGKEEKAVPPTQDVTKKHARMDVACLSFGDPEPRRFLRRCPPLHGRGGEMMRALDGWMDVCCNFGNFICDDTTLYPKRHIRYCTWHITLAIAYTPCHTRFRLPAEIRALHSLFDAEAARKISIAFDLITAWASIQSCL